MSVHDDLASAQRALEDLLRSVGRLEHRLGNGPEMRRVRIDAQHLRDSVALLREASRSSTPAQRPTLVTLSDTPYDISLWTDSDDEGLGARNRHAP
ncbi:hypothetical protein STXM2123_4420 [Streptomyces sp. F-3]|jgi:hypothetical protein|uniref:hypothetical protein n=2 Tax=Streptomyces TaxID=1883 RepID=UPI0007C3BC35|nr:MULTISPECIES: hypothetical protein [unclassified Streptomyces]MDN5385433.1 hypothetical protein [Streptomyces sp. LB8]GAT83720.1 hypothetical protein STXM2123_4420 [Streptomyces sp. F-3]